MFAPEFTPFTDGFRPFVYQGRSFGENDIAEANAAAKSVLDTVLPNHGSSVTVRFISDADFATIGAETAPEDEQPAPPPQDAPPETSEGELTVDEPPAPSMQEPVPVEPVPETPPTAETTPETPVEAQGAPPATESAPPEYTPAPADPFPEYAAPADQPPTV